jgi:hypothetical protein
MYYKLHCAGVAGRGNSGGYLVVAQEDIWACDQSRASSPALKLDIMEILTIDYNTSKLLNMTSVPKHRSS